MKIKFIQSESDVRSSLARSGFELVLFTSYRFTPDSGSSNLSYGYGQFWQRNLVHKAPAQIKQEYAQKTLSLAADKELQGLNKRKVNDIKLITLAYDHSGALGNHSLDMLAFAGKRVAKRVLQECRPRMMLNFEALLTDSSATDNIIQDLWNPLHTKATPKETICHHMRAYWDDKYHLHWFDPNLGWFKSRDPKPDQTAITNFLAQQFKLAGYSNLTVDFSRSYMAHPDDLHMYKELFEPEVATAGAKTAQKPAKKLVQTRLQKEPPPLRFLPQTTAAESSDDESEYDQLVRLNNNRRPWQRLLVS